jgi:diketogulonate reductase-like aldo/keto reductase
VNVTRIGTSQNLWNIAERMESIFRHIFCQFTQIYQFIFQQAYSSFGSETNREDLFADEKVKAMAAKYGCTVPAFLLGWGLAQGMSVLPRSRNPEHVRANFIDVKGLKVSAEDVEMAKADRLKKYCWNPEGIR